MGPCRRVLVTPDVAHTTRVYYTAPERVLVPRHYVPPEVHEVQVLRETPVIVRSEPQLDIQVRDPANLSDPHTHTGHPAQHRTAP